MTTPSTSIVEVLRPKRHFRVYDVVRATGVDVSDWEASRVKARTAASNPKYCYNWSFVEPGRVVVLNLWHEDVQERGSVVTIEWNAREIARTARGITITRATAMDEAIQLAAREKLPIRVVLCAGARRNRKDPNSKASRVALRLLDPEPWHVARYDMKNGQCTLQRGLGDGADAYEDQFDQPPPEGGAAERITTKGSAFVRRPEVRRFALRRAKGRCEFCGEPGFRKANGRLYLETHHVKPLHAGGLDAPDNVAALCPNHHREAHHGDRKSVIRDHLLAKLKR